MKKIYLMLGAAFTVYAVQGQDIQNDNSRLPLTKHEQFTSESGKKIKPQQTATEKVLLWSDGFDDPTNWVINNTSSPTGGSWIITTNVNDMPVAAADLHPFASTTVSDGYALIDSDGSVFQGDGSGTISGTIRTATPIDLTGEDFVMLRYQNNYRWWQDTRGVRVSGDNGVTWTEYYLTDDGTNVPGLTYPNNQNSENPDIVEINISASAGGQNQVLIEFFYSDNNIWGWYWAVDDVEIRRLPENDLQVGTVWPGDIITAYDYSRIPTTQASAMTVGAAISNLGYVSQNNVPVTLTIERDGAVVHTVTNNFNFPVDPLAFETDTVWFNTTFVPSDLGVYEISVTVPSDDNPANNEGNTTMETTQNIWGHDYDEGGVYRFDRDDETTMGATFAMQATQTIYGLDVIFNNQTTEEGVYVEVWDASGGSIQAMEYVTGNYYVIQPGDLAGGVVTTITFDDAAQLVAGGVYVIQVRKEFGTSRLFFDGSASGDDDFATVCYGPFGGGGAVNYFLGWGFSPAIRANFDETLAVSNNSLLSIPNVYPNPATNHVMIPLEDGQVASATLVDLSGKVIASTQIVGLSHFSTEGVANGVYMLNIETSEGIATQKVVIRN
jgi:hypothetical protein